MKRIRQAVGNVIPWPGSSARLEPHKLNTLRAYWEALRDESDGAIPARLRVDPRGFSNALEHAFLLERVAPGMAKFRLAGAHLGELMGMELRGMPFAALFLPQDRGAVQAVLAEVFDLPAEAELTLRPARLGNAPDASARMVLLPLRDREGSVTAALGGLVSTGATGAPPQRFEIAARSLSPCGGTAPPAPAPAEDRLAPGFAEPAADFEGPGERPARGRPRLRVVKPDE